MLDLAVYVGGHPQLAIARAMAAAAPTPASTILAQVASRAGALQALYTSRAAATADLLVANRWSPLYGGKTGTPSEAMKTSLSAVRREEGAEPLGAPVYSMTFDRYA
eukprot:SAG31_NODE_48_length_30945_cov_16.254263_4_plen_107_part_00